MLRVGVDTSTATYDVLIGEGLLTGAASLVVEALDASTIVIVSDERVADLYAATLREDVRALGVETHVVTVPPGEQSKSWHVAGDVLERLVATGLDRAGGIVALGGGVVGDLAGFCAATYMRGVPFVQIPTTLLAQVDSSVGGKTAVDLPAGKNLVGAFIQPRLVIADTSVLTSLPDSEWRSGLAEVVKSGILDSEELLTWMELNARGLAARDAECVTEAVRACVAFKARIVASDEHEHGARESLNYGHTLGHALETVAGYGVYSHGAAVAEGIRFAAQLAERVLGAPREFSLRQVRLLDAVGLGVLAYHAEARQLRDVMNSDKKARSGRPRFVLVPQAGTYSVCDVDDEILAEELDAWVNQRRDVGR